MSTESRIEASDAKAAGGVVAADPNSNAVAEAQERLEAELAWYAQFADDSEVAVDAADLATILDALAAAQAREAGCGSFSIGWRTLARPRSWRTSPPKRLRSALTIAPSTPPPPRPPTMTDTGETMGLRDAVAPDLSKRLLRETGSFVLSPASVDTLLTCVETAQAALKAAQARIVELEAALAPFAKVAEHYGGHDDADLVVVDLGQCRTARAAFRKGPQQ